MEFARGSAARGGRPGGGADRSVDRGLLRPAERTIRARIAFASPDAHAALHEDGNRGELLLTAMPPPPAGKVYEVWVQRGRQPPAPTDALFTVNRTGNGTVSVPGGLGGVREVLVSAEPLGGSRHLTGPALIRVRLPS